MCFIEQSTQPYLFSKEKAVNCVVSCEVTLLPPSFLMRLVQSGLKRDLFFFTYSWFHPSLFADHNTIWLFFLRTHKLTESIPMLDTSTRCLLGSVRAYGFTHSAT